MAEYNMHTWDLQLAGLHFAIQCYDITTNDITILLLRQTNRQGM